MTEQILYYAGYFLIGFLLAKCIEIRKRVKEFKKTRYFSHEEK